MYVGFDENRINFDRITTCVINSSFKLVEHYETMHTCDGHTVDVSGGRVVRWSWVNFQCGASYNWDG